MAYEHRGRRIGARRRLRRIAWRSCGRFPDRGRQSRRCGRIYAAFRGGMAMRILFVSLILFVASLRAAEPIDVLVQGAEKLEVREIVAALGPQAEKINLGPFTFWLGRIGPHRVAVSLT